MDQAEFIAIVQERMDCPSADDAATVVAEVLKALARALPAEERALLAEALPPAVGEHLLDGRAEYDPLIDEHLFIGHLMTEHQTTGYWDKTAGGEDVLASAAAEEIERRARAVLSLVAVSIPEETLRPVCAALPPVLESWFRGEGEPAA